MLNVDWLVVGAGFTGSVFAERLAHAGRKVVIIDQRPHVGGNAYDERNEQGILVHRYGPHIFHTNSPRVWNYLSQFTDWIPYEHHVLGQVESSLVPIPFNLNSLTKLFSEEAAAKAERALVETYGHGSKVPILKLRTSPDLRIKELADYIYDRIYRGYTLKQWGLRPEELKPGVTGRVPVRISRDDRYFPDVFQGMPAQGYTAMFEKMLASPNIEVLLGCDWPDIRHEVQADRVLYCGALDELLDFRFGPLPYRSCRFEQRTLQGARYQTAGTINYPNDHAFTRITEQKTLTGQTSAFTTLITEYPVPHDPGRTIPYYPIPSADNDRAYRRYLAEALAAFPNMVFAGRLADYQYYNMDQACASALTLAASCTSHAPAHVSAN